MQLSNLEILASILIIFSLIKIIIVSISPQSWFNFAKKLYSKPQITSLIALILAAIVLYVLIKSGITIVEILSVTVFIMLILMVGLAHFGSDLVEWISGKDIKTYIKNQFLYIIIWLALLIWGIKEIYFS